MKLASRPSQCVLACRGASRPGGGAVEKNVDIATSSPIELYGGARQNKRMSNRNVFIGIGVGCGAMLLLTVMCGGAGYFFVRSAFSASGEISQITDDVIRSMNDGSVAESYQTQMAPEFRQAASPEAYERLANQIRTQLGPLRSKTMSRINMHQKNAASFADVQYQATFEKGKGTIHLRLKRYGGKWLVQGFHVNSTALTKDIPSKTCPKCQGAYADGSRFCPHCGASLSSESEAE
jgi:hypothetical protein